MTYEGRARRAEYEVRPILHADVVRLVTAFHYARGCSLTAVYDHGLFHKTRGLVGCATWLPPTRVCAESVDRERWRRVLSLSRLVVVPGEPKNAASILLGGSIKRIRAEKKWVALVTFADERQGHSGGIYRATNWTYCGARATAAWETPDGRQVAALSTKTRTKAQMLALGYKRLPPSKKHKFIMVLA